MGFNINAADVLDLLTDKKLMDEVVEKVLDDPDTMDDLAGSIAEELSDIMQDDPRFTSKVMSSAMKDASLKKRIIKKLVDDLS